MNFAMAIREKPSTGTGFSPALRILPYGVAPSGAWAARNATLACSKTLSQRSRNWPVSETPRSRFSGCRARAQRAM